MEDMSSVRGMLSNRVSRTLLIVASTNLFVMVGMLLGAKELLSIASDTPTTPTTVQSETAAGIDKAP
jgi:uncharacterized metal-binding protein